MLLEVFLKQLLMQLEAKVNLAEQQGTLIFLYCIVLPVDEMIIYKMRVVTSDEPTENCPKTLQFPADPQILSASLSLLFFYFHGPQIIDNH